VGDGPLRKSLEQQSLALGLAGAVFFEGFREDVRPYLQAGSAFVLTSRREGLPLAILEAMACGLPCIVTRVGGNCEVVTHGINGLLVSPGSVDEIASAISHLATHRQECQEMSRMAQLRVRQEFDLDDRMAQITKVILN
jgi:glycosyltransferase involved in cell wall biosynthesis